jgi:2-keto-3-deoxy-L-rhamnonate aldolase RhmA
MSTVQCGTFIKTASYQIVELLGDARFDFAVLDAEHAPLDRLTVDVMMLAGRSVQLPLFVRVSDQQPATLLSVLDMGAAGLLVPHVDTAEQARAVVANAKYAGARGYSGSPRSGGYGGLSRDTIIKQGDATWIICQIESAEGVRNVAEIAALPGVDGVFLGRADLALSMQIEAGSAEMRDAIETVGAAAAANGKIFGMFVSDGAELTRFAALGANWFIISSDQSMLRNAARTTVDHARSVTA